MAPPKRSSKPQEPRKQTAAHKPTPKITKARRDAIWRALPGLPGVVFWKWLQDAASLPSLADGPVGDDGFRWESRECHGLRPLAHRLLAFLWCARDHSAVFRDLKELVWENREARISSDMVGSVRRELNRFFEGNAIPFKVTVKRDRVTLVRLRQ